MRDKIEKRLLNLKSEFEAGQKMLTDLNARQTNVRETMLRISGAIQVLEELLAQKEQGTETEQTKGAKFSMGPDREGAIQGPDTGAPLQ